MLEPLPEEWLEETGRLVRLESELGRAWQAISLGGLGRAVLESWIRYEVWQSVQKDSSKTVRIDPQTRRNGAEDSIADRSSDRLDKKKRDLKDGLLEWCATKWKHQVSQLFLAQKEKLDRVDCRLLRVKQIALAQELYYRLKDDSIGFEELSFKFGLGPESRRGGDLKTCRIKDLPYGLSEYVVKMQPGELLQPCRLNDHIVIVFLERREPATLNQDLRDELLLENLNTWIYTVASIAKEELNSRFITNHKE